VHDTIIGMCMAAKLLSLPLQRDSWLSCCPHVPNTQGNQLEESSGTGQWVTAVNMIGVCTLGGTGQWVTAVNMIGV